MPLVNNSIEKSKERIVDVFDLKVINTNTKNSLDTPNEYLDYFYSWHKDYIIKIYCNNIQKDVIY